MPIFDRISVFLTCDIIIDFFHLFRRQQLNKSATSSDVSLQKDKDGKLSRLVCLERIFLY